MKKLFAQYVIIILKKWGNKLFWQIIQLNEETAQNFIFTEFLKIKNKKMRIRHKRKTQFIN